MSEQQHAVEDDADDVQDIPTAQVDQDIKDGDRKKGKLVTVTVDTKPHTVRKGRYIVNDFKRLVGVDPTYQLDEVVNGEFIAVLFREEDEGETSYQFQMAILDVDLEQV